MNADLLLKLSQHLQHRASRYRIVDVL